MTAKQFEQLKEHLHNLANGIANAKRPGYTQGNADVLRNFKRVAGAVPNECPACGHGFTLNPGQVWAVYLLKHVDAVVSGAGRPGLPQAEPLDGRFADLLNYADLGFGIVVEQAVEQSEQGQRAQTCAPDSAPPPRPQSVPQKASPPVRPAESNILPWKSRRDRVEPPLSGGIPTHQHEHLTNSEAPEAVQLKLPFEGSFVEFPVEDDGVVDDRDWGEIDKARRRIEVANAEAKRPIT
jgi:hypothetical protein